MGGVTDKKLSEIKPIPWPDPAREIGAPEVTKGIFGELFKGKNKRKKRDKRDPAA
ncbi:MAG TPA: hypothetical protein VHB53_07965 [Solirubrobacterales bacterium]|nr:hypothetical protein [Solirubrobacterales bacterium]